MAAVGYARVSTEEQELTTQLELLQAAGVEKIFQEKASGVREDRPELGRMLEYVREGDAVVVCKLDRIARSTKHLLEIVETLEKRKAAFRVLNINLDTSTPTGKLMLTMLGAIATFEREMMLERQREGIAVAKAKGTYTGRKPTAREQAARIVELIGQGKTKQAVADELGIGVASVYRIVREARQFQRQGPKPEMGERYNLSLDR
jgi:DNA invertase Pin-like site-specific DNA recombinase